MKANLSHHNSALPADYSSQKQILATGDTRLKQALAESPDTLPEVLYYLAEDADPQIRQAVAANAQTPQKADLLLAVDNIDEIRAQLALKISRLLPDMPTDEQQRVRDMSLELLDILAQDQLPRVRALVAEAIKDSRHLSKRLVRRLAQDMENIVAVPVLEYSPLLSDADLIELIAASRAEGALRAIAGRRDLSPDVSDAVAATLDIPAVASLLANKSAQIREDTLDRIIDSAVDIENWHEPLAFRPDLSMRAIRRIAGFVAASLVETLVAQNQLDAETEAALKNRITPELENLEGEATEAEADRVQRLFEHGLLDNDCITEAAGKGERQFLIHAIALLAKMETESVKVILGSRMPEPITALIWAAGLSMRSAIAVQSTIGNIRPQHILNARNGTDFPLPHEEMQKLLSIHKTRKS